MGVPNSKISHAAKNVQTDEGSLPSTPILTPKVKILDNDPRSPSANIARTPIQSVMDDNKPDTSIIGVIHSEDQENSSVNIDPRSPAVEFVRTPIVVGNQPMKLHNKNLDNVRQKLINLTPMKMPGELLNRSKGPKLIGISPVIIKKVDQSEKRKSYVGVLETDLDFVETDIDQATKLNNTKTLIEKESIFDENDLISEDNSLISEESNEHSELDEPKEKISKTEILEEVECSSNVTPPNIEETERVLTKNEIISPIQETLERISQIDKEIKEVIACSPTIDLDEEAESKEFDKKVTNLIYEDEEVVRVIPKNLITKNENRTPLSERNINHSKKATSKLKVHDKPRKIDYSVSKIPVFKEKKENQRLTFNVKILLRDKEQSMLNNGRANGIKTKH